MRKRGSGILCHITCLPSPYGIGDMGQGSRDFVDFLSASGQTCWQILPLTATNPGLGNSPYSSPSAFAGNFLLISPEMLVRDGFLEPSDLDGTPCFPTDRVDFGAVARHRDDLLRRAFARFLPRAGRDALFARFKREHQPWLEDFSLFTALKDRFHGSSWLEWPAEFRDRRPHALERARTELAEQMLRHMFVQYLFFSQWQELKGYCNRRSIQIVGDIPIYVSLDSADVWSNPEMFKLGSDRCPQVVAGVPPDYFSATGQLWGNPVYDWDRLQATGFDWWIRRLEHCFTLYDLTRIDHFRGLVAYWEVPAGEETAVNGSWVEVPVDAFFQALLRRFGTLPLIAEDLGLITPDVKEVLCRYPFPGMKVLLFAFGGGTDYQPHRYERNCLVYTGTHDTNTVHGWFEQEADHEVRKRLFAYLGRKVGLEELHWELIRMALSSVADTAIIPLQDVLGLGPESRMNTPAQSNGNWTWRCRPELLTDDLAKRLGEMVRVYERD